MEFSANRELRPFDITKPIGTLIDLDCSDSGNGIMFGTSPSGEEWSFAKSNYYENFPQGFSDGRKHYIQLSLIKLFKTPE